MIELEVYLDGHPPTPNRRMHWRAWGRVRAEWRGWTKIAALVALRSSGEADAFPLSMIVVEPTFYFRTNRRRDDDNLIASLKPMIDGLVDARVVPDDSRDRLSLLRPRIEVGPRDGVGLRIEEVS